MDHLNPPPDIDAGVPVEIFAEPWSGPALSVSEVVGDLVAALERFPEDSEVRIAVPVDTTHHRCLTIVSLGFVEGGEDEPPLALGTERWDSQDMIIRMNDPQPSTDPGA